jgi:hypothetical protein
MTAPLLTSPHRCHGTGYLPAVAHCDAPPARSLAYPLNARRAADRSTATDLR